MAESSRYYKIDNDILLEFIYHDQGDTTPYEVDVDDNGSEIKVLDTVQGDSTQTRHLINELGSDVVNFDVTEDGAYIAIENFAARTLLLEIGKTYKFDLSTLSVPGDFAITGTNNGPGLVGTIFEYIPANTGNYTYSLTNFIGGKVTIGNTANPLFATPDEETGNSIVTGSGSIGRYMGVNVNENKYALLDNNNIFINSIEWNGSNSADLLASQTAATAAITKVKYDKVRLHLRSGFSFAARGYEGFLFEITTDRTSEVKNFLTQIVYLNTSSFEIKNPRPFILSETLYSSFIEVKLPTLINQFSDFENFFYDNGSGISDLDPTSNFSASLKLIDRVEDTAGIDYFYTGEETNFLISREDEFQDFTVVVEEANDGDYFSIYGEKDGSAADFESYIINRIATSSDDISVIYDITVNELIGTSFIETYATTLTQTQDFEEHTEFRPIIKNANTAISFLIDVTMRIYNQTDNTQIVKRASLIYNNPAKYGKRLLKVNIASTANLTRVYNTLPNLQATRNVAQVINSSLPKAQVKYAPAFIERLNIIVNVGNVTIDDGQISSINNDNGLEISPFDMYVKFNISKIEGGERKTISFTNLKNVRLNFSNGIYFNNITSFKEVDMSNGEVLFKIDKANSVKLQGLSNKTYYISIDSGSNETMVFKGDYNAI
jgi:hypothetical protein